MFNNKIKLIYLFLLFLSFFYFLYNVNRYNNLKKQINLVYKINKNEEKKTEESKIKEDDSINIQAFFYSSSDDWFLIINNSNFSPTELKKNNIEIKNISKNSCTLEINNIIYNIDL